MKLICPYCGYTDDLDSFDNHPNYPNNYWCPDCDGFIELNNQKEIQERNQLYLLLLEDKSLASPKTASNIKLKKQNSPLRYPGGKSKMLERIYAGIKKDKVFVEPFAGGASLSLGLLLNGKVDRIVINDLDFGWYALFYRILNDTENLCQEIINYTPNKDDYYKYQKYILEGYNDKNIHKAAMAFLVVNRCSYSGIAMANCMSDIMCRWNPDSLIKRIKNIASKKDLITICNKDAFEVIEEYYWNEETTIFVDPPYIKAGDSLYPIKFKLHSGLAQTIEQLYQGIPGADFIITYDNDEFLKNYYELANKVKIGVSYTI